MVDVIYESSERETLNNAQEAARRALMKDYDFEEDDYRVDNDENQDKQAEGMEWDFYDLQDSGRRCAPALQTIWDVYTRYNFKEPPDLVEALAIIENGVYSIPRVMELTDQLAETKETCLSHK